MSTYQAMTSYEQAKHDELMRGYREQERQARLNWIGANVKALEAINATNDRMRARVSPPPDDTDRRPVPPPILPYKD